MARRSAVSSRWLILALIAALTGSALAGWALVRVTGQAGATPTAASVGGSASGGSDPPDSTRPPAASTSEVGVLGPGDATRPTDVVGSTGRPPRVLPGSRVILPAAWTGTAELTITVDGECSATGGTSIYSGLAADLALQQPLAGSDAFGDANPFAMTLGVTPAAIPGLALYSAALDDRGAVRRTWWLTAGIDPDAPERTQLSGALIADRPVDGDPPPNLLVDNETDLLPCQSGRPSGVSRTLGAGSSLSGWLSPTEAVIDLTGSTTDGERTIRVHVELHRRVSGP